MAQDSTVVGEKYLVRYRIKGVQRYDRTLVGRFIGRNPVTNQLLFSGRSDERHGRGTDTTHAYGTLTIGRQHILDIKHVAQNTPCHADRRAETKRAPKRPS